MYWTGSSEETEHKRECQNDASTDYRQQGIKKKCHMYSAGQLDFRFKKIDTCAGKVDSRMK
jgi:hypothetical protein